MIRVRATSSRAPRCPFCHDVAGGAGASPCSQCGARVHASCLSEAGGACPSCGHRSSLRVEFKRKVELCFDLPQSFYERQVEIENRVEEEVVPAAEVDRLEPVESSTGRVIRVRPGDRIAMGVLWVAVFAALAMMGVVLGSFLAGLG